ncbi:MAG: amidohydrolase family protein [Phycisphaerae bacterium]|nr:amidohydrolase family protein [Phycisphaerae bacterium]
MMKLNLFAPRASAGTTDRGFSAAQIGPLTVACLMFSLVHAASAQVAIKGKTIHTMGAAGTLNDAVVVITDGKIAAVGPIASTPIPQGYRVLEGEIVTPGLIDCRATVGLTGIYNIKHDQDQLESSTPIQPQLRAIDAYNPHEELIDWVRRFGVTAVHTGHAPGELISGQTAVFKLRGNTVADATMVECAAIAATLGPSSQKDGGKSPGTRAKQISLLRQELIRAQEYIRERESAAKNKDGAKDEDNDNENGGKRSKGRDLSMESLVRVLKGELPLMITANRSQDIMSALRLAEEFKFRLWLDSASEAYLLLDEIKKAGVPVLVHPLMYRASGEMKNMSFETPALVRDAKIPVFFTSGFEDYVPKTRVVLFEAGVAAANGLTLETTLRMLTIEAATLLGIDKRVGSLEVGKDGDVAIYDGDPFEYASHCTGVVIEGEVMSDKPR